MHRTKNITLPETIGGKNRHFRWDSKDTNTTIWYSRRAQGMKKKVVKNMARLAEFEPAKD
jgi:hypothetical protein